MFLRPPKRAVRGHTARPTAASPRPYDSTDMSETSVPGHRFSSEEGSVNQFGRGRVCKSDGCDTTEAGIPKGRQGTRAQLHDVLTTLTAELREAEQAQPPDEPHHPVVVGLANWLPQVGQACENPETAEAELDQLLSEATDALEGLREIALSAAAA